MDFDYKKYISLRDEMLARLEHLSYFTEYQSMLSDMCEFLRIAKIEIDFYETSADLKIGNSKHFLFFEDTRFPCGGYYKKYVNEKGEFATLWKIYGIKGDSWSDEERERVVVLQKSLGVFHSRINALISMESNLYRDKEFKMLSIAYLKKQIQKILDEKRWGKFGICCYNIKHFSVINQMMSHDNADKVLIAHSRGIERFLGGEGCVVKNGGDNFLALFEKDKYGEVKKYLEETEVYFKKDNGSGKISENNQNKDCVTIGTRAGFYYLTAEDKSVQDILDKVNTAYREARSPNSVDSVLYDLQLQLKQENKEFVETNFESAMKNNEFRVFYQPKVNIKNYHLAGAEALCRWFRCGEMIPPGDFIPVLDQNNAICALDFYILEKVCQDLHNWINQGKTVVKVSVNFSRQHLGNKSLFNRIMEIIDKYEVPHSLIEIELTETTTDVDFKDMKDIVIPLREMGVGTSIDDFGCGYSSLNMMRALPWSIVKIDRSFLYGENNGNMNSSTSEPSVMLNHIIAMAKEHGLECIVEGVETIEHVKLLKKNGCYLAQGYYFDRPLAKEEFEKRMDKIGSI